MDCLFYIARNGNTPCCPGDSIPGVVSIGISAFMDLYGKMVTIKAPAQFMLRRCLFICA